jgi:hypothetical protein
MYQVALTVGDGAGGVGTFIIRYNVIAVIGGGSGAFFFKTYWTRFLEIF